MLEDMQPNEWAIEQEKKLSRYNYLVKSIFNSEEGQELLKIWSEADELIPVAKPGMDYLEIGIEQGKRNFVHQIKLQLKRELKND